VIRPLDERQCIEHQALADDVITALLTFIALTPLMSIVHQPRNSLVRINPLQ
jgi:hypothetical protein